jgi:hypothetical protein
MPTSQRILLVIMNVAGRLVSLLPYPVFTDSSLPDDNGMGRGTRRRIMEASPGYNPMFPCVEETSGPES